jgi:hypothetical protein
MKALAAAAVCLVVLAVGGDEITTQQLDALVEHFRTEAKLEGKTFPQDGSPELDKLRNQLLGLLVYRTELKQAAERFGVTVEESEIARRLPTGEQEADTRGDTFAHDTVASQIRLERLFAKVTQGEMSAGERNTTWAEFLARLRDETKVRYEPGYGPGS